MSTTTFLLLLLGSTLMAFGLGYVLWLRARAIAVQYLTVAVRPELDTIYREAQDYDLSGWRSKQVEAVVLTGAASSLLPLVGVAVEIGFLAQKLSLCSYGIGAILGKSSGEGNILEPEDFPIILALWAEEPGVSEAIRCKTASLAGKLGGKGAAKVLAKTMCQNAGLLVGNKFAGKLGGKIGKKVVTKLTAKAGSGLVPGLGILIGGYVNHWLISGIANSAEQWYRCKLNLAPKIVAHRGGQVLVIGILSFVFLPFILGPIAWMMGRHDLREMDAGRMNRAGRSDTNVGHICGMLSTLMVTVPLMIGLCCGGVIVTGITGVVWDSAPKSVAPGTTRQQPAVASPLPIVDSEMAAGWNVPKGRVAVRCRHCDGLVQVNESQRTTARFRCARCNQVFELPKSD